MSNVRECIYSLDGVEDKEYSDVFVRFLTEVYPHEVEDILTAGDATQVTTLPRALAFSRAIRKDTTHSSFARSLAHAALRPHDMRTLTS